MAPFRLVAHYVWPVWLVWLNGHLRRKSHARQHVLAIWTDYAYSIGATMLAYGNADASVSVAKHMLSTAYMLPGQGQ